MGKKLSKFGLYISVYIYFIYGLYIFGLYIVEKIVYNHPSYCELSLYEWALKKDAKKDILFLIFKFRSQYRENWYLNWYLNWSNKINNYEKKYRN